MKGYLKLAAAHPWSVILILSLISVAAGSQLHKLKVHVSPQALSVENDAAKEFYERSAATFGSDNVTLVVVRDPDLFGHETLNAIRSTVARLEALSFVASTESLFSVPHVKVVDEFVHTAPYLEENPETPGHAEAIRSAALENPFVRRNLLSEDGTTLAINVHLDRGVDDAEFGAHAVAGIEAAIAPLKPVVEETFQIGMPYVRTFVRDAIHDDQKIVLPLSVTVLLFSLTLFFRGATAAIPLLTAGLSVLWTLGGMAALGIHVTVMTAIVPVLIIIIGSTEDIHLIAEYREAVAGGYRRRRALVRMARRKGLAVMLTFLTSYLGFLAVAVNPIHLLREFGLVASTGLFFNFFVNAALVPLCLRIFGEKKLLERTGSINRNRDRLVGASSRLLRFRKPWIILFTLAITALSVHGALSLRLNNNIRNYLPEDSVIEQRTDALHQALSGLESFSIILDGDIEGTFQRSRYLGEIVELQQYVEEHPAFDSSLSVTDHLAVLNGAVNESGKAELPDDDLVLAELTNFVDHENLARFVSADFSQARIFVRHDIGSSHDLKEALSELDAFIAESTDDGLTVNITGESVLSHHAADQMATGQAKSLGLMLVAVFVVISLLFLNARAGMIAVISNAFPLIVLFGVMGYAGIPLDTGTSMIAAIALGICVDNTMHFLVRYNNELKRHRSELEAVEKTMRGEAIPITTSTVALSLGLGTLAFSSFGPLVHFGLLSGMVILLAYYANFFITPMLLSATRLTTLWDLLSIDVRNVLAHHCALLQGLRPREIRRIILHGQVREYRAGESIMCQGDKANEMFVLLEGAGKLSTAENGHAGSPPLSLQAGDVFGLTAMVSDESRIASATAEGDAKVLVLSRDSIQRLARFHTHTAFQLYRNLSAILGTRFARKVTGSAPAEAAEHDLSSPNGKVVDLYRFPKPPHAAHRPPWNAGREQALL